MVPNAGAGADMRSFFFACWGSGGFDIKALADISISFCYKYLAYTSNLADKKWVVHTSQVSGWRYKVTPPPHLAFKLGVQFTGSCVSKWQIACYCGKSDSTTENHHSNTHLYTLLRYVCEVVLLLSVPAVIMVFLSDWILHLLIF